MKKKSVVVLLTVTMVIEMTAAGCGDKQLALATDRVSVELGYELNTDVAAYWRMRISQWRQQLILGRLM